MFDLGVCCKFEFKASFLLNILKFYYTLRKRRPFLYDLHHCLAYENALQKVFDTESNF